MCKASGKIVNNQMIMGRQHCHQANLCNYENELFKDSLWQQVVTTEDDLRHIWERVALKYVQYNA